MIPFVVAPFVFSLVTASLPYQVDKPDDVISLPHKLSEISGLALSNDGNFLWAVQDEKGILYKLSIRDGRIDKTIPFKKKGDFEEVTTREEHVIVARSDGHLFDVDPDDTQAEPQEIDSGLTKACNVEGMTYDESERRFLLACKSATGSKDNRAWNIWGFDWKKKKLSKEPAFALTRKGLEEYAKAHDDKELTSAMIKDMAPSAIALHPKSRNLYVLSSRGQALVVLNPKGEIVSVQKLPRAVHPQPEGLAISWDGTLFISNEGRQDNALLLRFVPK